MRHTTNYTGHATKSVHILHKETCILKLTCSCMFPFFFFNNQERQPVFSILFIFYSDHSGCVSFIFLYLVILLGQTKTYHSHRAQSMTVKMTHEYSLASQRGKKPARIR